MPCGQWSAQDWEDGGNSALSLLLSQTDVHYDVQGACGMGSGPAGVALVQ